VAVYSASFVSRVAVSFLVRSTSAQRRLPCRLDLNFAADSSRSVFSRETAVSLCSFRLSAASFRAASSFSSNLAISSVVAISNTSSSAFLRFRSSPGLTHRARSLPSDSWQFLTLLSAAVRSAPRFAALSSAVKIGATVELGDLELQVPVLSMGILSFFPSREQEIASSRGLLPRLRFSVPSQTLCSDWDCGDWGQWLR
jgi:hypothetical protein